MYLPSAVREGRHRSTLLGLGYRNIKVLIHDVIQSRLYGRDSLVGRWGEYAGTSLYVLEIIFLRVFMNGKKVHHYFAKSY